MVTAADQEILDPKQVHAATLLSAGHSIDEVCSTLSVGRATLYRWRQDPRFAAYMHQLLRTHADQAICQSAQLLSLSFARIRALMEDPKTSPELQLRISFKLLNLYSRPSFIRYLKDLPDDPLEVAEQDVYRANRAVGHDNPTNMDGSDFELKMCFHEEALKAAKAFDIRHPNPQLILQSACARPALQPAAQKQLEPPRPSRPSVRQNET